MIYDQKLEETVLIPVLRPPFRGEHSAYISIVTGRGPGADQSVIDVKLISLGQLLSMPGASELISAESESWVIF